VVLILVASVTGAWLWWATQLMGLPDIGDPFDVEAFRTKSIPDDQNAFVLYRQAASLFKPLEFSDTSASLPVDLHTRWPTAGLHVRRWAEVNRNPLAIYRRGADRPDSLDSSLIRGGGYVEFDALRPLQRLTLLEASRLESQGDMAEAWGWYRTYLRTIHHVGLHGRFYRRMFAQHWYSELRKRLTNWAADARTTPAQLRLALDDVIACEALAPSESYTLKAEYLHGTSMFAEGNYPGRYTAPSWLTEFNSWAATSIGPLLTPEWVQRISDAWSFCRREPERSRRVIQLITAKQLAFFGLPPDSQPSPDPNVSSCDLYPFGPEAPAKARTLSPMALSLWLDSTRDAREVIGLLNWKGLRTRELRNHRELVMLLANELYHRDRGTEPPSPDALVGPYLKRLPR
jgi:hypothetical protein